MRWLAALLLVLVAGPAGADPLDVAIGKALFKRPWVPAPSSTLANDGLGPLFGARACIACHQGLTRQPVELGAAGEVAGAALVLRLSGPDGEPDPVYGAQLQTAAVPGMTPEARLHLADHQPGLTELAFGPLAPSTRTGLRIAPALRGLGGFETIPDAAILALADPADRDGDGVRGRVRWVTDGEGRQRVGRYGWKLSTATLADQTALAFMLDLGLSTAQHPDAWGDCTAAQADCLTMPHGGDAGDPEIRPDLVQRIALYLAALPPPRAEPDPAGAALFAAIGCAACHRPSLAGAHGEVAAWTDLLLHDLGPDLDGGATEPGVAPSEWRTAPLWGTAQVIAAGAGFLHDGSAPTLDVAIRRHGGEAAGARARFLGLAAGDRQRLLDYVATR